MQGHVFALPLPRRQLLSPISVPIAAITPLGFRRPDVAPECRELSDYS
jgi:hypothetical protein